MRIVLADRQHRVRRALSLLLARQPGWQVVGQASTAEELDQLLANTAADVLLLDWDLSVHLALLGQRKAGLRIIALSGQPEVREAATAAGADDFVSKGDPPERLLAAIRRCQQP